MHVLVHGGAGDAPDEPSERRTILEKAVAVGSDAETPVEAVVAGVSILEGSPRFNAGVGGSLQSDGVVRTDAGIMTERRAVGAVCGMEGVRDAARVARLVMDETPHVLLVGDPATAFAASQGIETDAELLTDRTRERWAETDAPASASLDAQLARVRDRFGESGSTPRDHDTVGAVAADGNGALAALTSTGGRWGALAGRVGDVPQVGSGFFATPAGGASATGVGEDIVRTTLSRRAVSALETGATPQEAAETAIEEFEAITDSRAGVIVMDSEGTTGSAYNTEAMQTARTGREN